MRNWAAKYVGAPADKTLAGNCLGLVREVLRTEFGKEFPGFLGAMRDAKDGKALPCTETKVLKDGVLVMCGNDVYPARHVGIYCKAVDRVVHAVTEEKIVRAEPLWRLRQEWARVALFAVD